jgi:hypothetical protein
VGQDAVSGTILSFEMGSLWPGLMGVYGQVLGLPFALEGFAFFIEAIFVGIYLYGWDRLPPRVHLLTAVPVAVSGVASAFFVVTANAWMNQPRGFELVDGEVTAVRPLAGHAQAGHTAADHPHDSRRVHGYRVHRGGGVRGRTSGRGGPGGCRRWRRPVRARERPDDRAEL